MLKISNSVLLNCYDNYHNGKCVMRYVNSPKNYISIISTTTRHVKANATVTTCPRMKTVALRATRNIKAHEEILYSYHAEYRFPPPEN
jgi:hypothetical protein